VCVNSQVIRYLLKLYKQSQPSDEREVSNKLKSFCLNIVIYKQNVSVLPA